MEERQFTAAGAAVGAAAAWVERNAAADRRLQAVAAELETDLLRGQARAQAAADLAPSALTVGVFGASQVGKSYLVESLASQNAGLTAAWDGEAFPFISLVNPTGNGHEATGVVTRFTHRPGTGRPGFPVEIRVLRETEVALCLCNSYFNDLAKTKKTNPYDETFCSPQGDTDPQRVAAFFAACEAHRAAGGPTAAVTPADMIGMADYVKTHSKGWLAAQPAAGEFWTRMRELAPTLDLSGRARLFSCLWGGLAIYTRLFERVAGDLAPLRGAGRVWAPLGVFAVRRDGRWEQLKHNLNNVETLNDLFVGTAGVEVWPDLPEAQPTAVPLAAAAAGTLEIVFPLDDGAGPLAGFDVLDFPGARSRDVKEIDAVAARLREPTAAVSGEDAQLGGELLRRGKVAYLFDRYNLRHEIDLILFCNDSAQQAEVTDLVTLLGDWVRAAAGATPAARAQLPLNPFIGVLTKMDAAISKDLDREEGTPSQADSLIEKTLERFKSQPWLQEWTPGRRHDQFFLIRRPHVKGNGGWIEYSPPAPGQPEREIAIKADLPRLRDFKAGLHRDPFFPHLYGGDAAIDALFTVGDGGIAYLTQFLAAGFTGREADGSLTAAAGKRRYLGEVADGLKRLKQRLGDFARPEAAAAQAAQETRWQRLWVDLQALVDLGAGGRLRQALEVTEPEAVACYNEGFAIGDNAPRFVDALLALWRGKLQSVAGGPACDGLVAVVWREWADRCRNAVHDPDATRRYALFYLPDERRFVANPAELRVAVADALGRWTQELLRGAQAPAIGLRERLIAALAPQEQLGLTREQLVRGQARRAADLLSDYNAYLGAAFARVEDGHGRLLFGEPVHVVLGVPGIEDAWLSRPGARYFADYALALRQLMVQITPTATADNRIDAAENADLCRLLTTLTQNGVK